MFSLSIVSKYFVTRDPQQRAHLHPSNLGPHNLTISFILFFCFYLLFCLVVGYIVLDLYLVYVYYLCHCVGQFCIMHTEAASLYDPIYLQNTR